jgi:hypothetical protein
MALPPNEFSGRRTERERRPKSDSLRLTRFQGSDAFNMPVTHPALRRVDRAQKPDEQDLDAAHGFPFS